MIRRVVWFAIGAGVGVYALVKVRSYLQQATPQALGQRAAKGAAGITDRVTSEAADFVGRVRAGMVEREAELRDAVGLSQPTD